MTGAISPSMLMINAFQAVYVWDALYNEQARGGARMLRTRPRDPTPTPTPNPPAPHPHPDCAPPMAVDPDTCTPPTRHQHPTYDTPTPPMTPPPHPPMTPRPNP